MKRRLDHGFDLDSETRAEEPIEAVQVEPLEAGPARRTYTAPLVIGGLVVLALGAAIFGNMGYFVGTVTPEPTLLAPTPIPWVDTTAAPTNSAEPGQTDPEPGSTAATPARPLTLRGRLTADSVLVHRGVPARFTLTLTNPNYAPISMAPCPAYRMYIASIDNSTAPIRLLNCAAIGPELIPNGTITLEMIYTPTMDAPLTGLKLVWQLESPDNVQALATVDISIGP